MQQTFAHIENNAANMERKMTFQQGLSGNPHGNRHRTRHLLNQEFMQALLLNFRHQGKKAIEKVARNQPAAYLKILALLVPREMKVEHTGGVKSMTDDQLEQGIEAIKKMLEARASGDQATVIEGVPEPAALPAPDRKAQRKVRRSDQVVGLSVGTDGTAAQAEKVNVIEGAAVPAALPASTALDQPGRKRPGDEEFGAGDRGDSGDA
jgi:hypothetical protein